VAAAGGKESRYALCKNVPKAMDQVPEMRREKVFVQPGMSTKNCPVNGLPTKRKIVLDNLLILE